MILNDWATVLNAYNASGSWKQRLAVFHSRKYWLIWVAAIAYAFGAWLLSYYDGWIAGAGLGMALLAFWFLFVAIEKALAQEFATAYANHSLAVHPFRERRLYLRYALFLEKFSEKNFSKKDIQAISKFAKIAGRPAPVFSLSQHSIVVAILALLTVLIAELIKETPVWKAETGAVSIVVLCFGLLLFVLAILDVLRSPKQKYVEMARFIEWATIDIDRMKSSSQDSLTPSPTTT